MYRPSYHTISRISPTHYPEHHIISSINRLITLILDKSHDLSVQFFYSPHAHHVVVGKAAGPEPQYYKLEPMQDRLHFLFLFIKGSQSIQVAKHNRSHHIPADRMDLQKSPEFEVVASDHILPQVVFHESVGLVDSGREDDVHVFPVGGVAGIKLAQIGVVVLLVDVCEILEIVHCDFLEGEVVVGQAPVSLDVGLEGV